MALTDDVRRAVRRQVEFYFSDSNLPRDRFLREKIEEDPEGYVSIPLLCSFKRMSGLLKLNHGTAAEQIPAELIAKVAAALADTHSIIVSDDGNKVKRTAPLTSPEQLVQDVNARSLYASPFPFNVTLEDLTAFFEEYGKVNSVRLRRHLSSKDFKGSIFVEFVDTATADKVLQHSIEHAGALLKLEAKNDYMKRKIEERTLSPNSAASINDQIETETSLPHPASNANALATAPTEPVAQSSTSQAASKEAAAPEQPAAAPAVAPAAQSQAPVDAQQQQMQQANGVGAAADGDFSAMQEATMPFFTSGTVLRFDLDSDDATDSTTLDYRAIRPVFGGKEGGVRHCEYKRGSTTGYIRFDTPEQAKLSLDGTDDRKIVICDCAATVRLLEGQEEQEFFRQADQQVKAAQQRDANGEGRGGRRGRGDRGGFRGRGGRGGRSRGRGGGRGQKRGNEGGALQGGYKLAKTD